MVVTQSARSGARTSPIQGDARRADTDFVAVDAAAVHARAGALALSATHALIALIAASFALRLALALTHATPYIFPDEYIYPAIARELAESGRPLVREGASFFPAFLEPLLVAPFHLTDDPGLAYRLTQGAHALAMSLAAVPAFLLARLLQLRTTVCLAIAVVAVAVPDLAYVSFMLAEPVGYPLALAAVYAGVRALERPTWRAQLAFVALAGLATFARLQYVAVGIAFVLAAAIVQRRALRVPLALGATVVAAALGVDPARALGPYRGLAQWSPDASDLVGWIGLHGLMFTWAFGAALAPAAVAGLACAHTRVERKFAALVGALALVLVAESAVIADFESSRFEERYLFMLVPLAATAAALWFARGRPYARVVAVSAGVLLLISLRVPASGYAFGTGKVDSPLLWAVSRLELGIGIGNASLALAVGLGAATVVAIAACFLRRGFTLAFGSTLVAFAAISVGAYGHVLSNADIVRARDLPAHARWVDRAGFEDVALLQTPGGTRRSAMEQFFWNRSVRDVLLFGGAEPFDSFGSRVVQVRDDGSLAVAGRPLVRPLLVQTYGVTAEFRGAVRVARGGTFELWRPQPRPRLSALTAGRYFDGWLARASQIFLWPDASGRTAGTLRLVLSMPPKTQATPLKLAGPGIDERVVVRPGKTRVVELKLDRCGPIAVAFATTKPGMLADTRIVSVRAERPVFTRIQATGRRCR